MTQVISEARAILTNCHALTERQYVGDTDAIIALLDFATAVERAKLTDRQAQALRLVYDVGMTQKDAGRAMGVRQNTVSEALSTAESKIQREYEKGRNDE